MSDNNNTKELYFKTCNKCKVGKTLNQYHKRRSSRDGHGTICKSCILAHVKSYCAQPEIKARKRAYDKALSKQAQYRERARKYNNNKYKTDPGYRVKHNLRMRLRDALKGFAGVSSASTIELLGCTIPELRLYLESMFKEGMNWSNYTRDGWHVDHIRPCAAFNLADPEQQKICFHYTNLQPLWADENNSKSSFFDGVKHYRKNQNRFRC